MGIPNGATTLIKAMSAAMHPTARLGRWLGLLRIVRITTAPITPVYTTMTYSVFAGVLSGPVAIDSLKWPMPRLLHLHATAHGFHPRNQTGVRKSQSTLNAQQTISATPNGKTSGVVRINIRIRTAHLKYLTLPRPQVRVLCGNPS